MNNEVFNQTEELETKKEKKRIRRFFRMLVALIFTSFIFIFATYAWFIGITTVNVNEFEVQVEAMDGLKLSLNGTSFANTVTINNTNYNTGGYSTINSFGGNDGITPVSSSGEFGSTGHLNIYKTSSISSSTGGYRLRSIKIDNGTNQKEHDNGYVVFDLYVKNTTNSSYNGTPTSYTGDIHEDIYLLAASQVSSKVDSSEGVTDVGEGVENAARVGFYSVAYAPLKHNDSNTTNFSSLDCTAESNTPGKVGLCAYTATANTRGILWNVWEPNDKSHIVKAINTYNNICKKRTGPAQFGDSCTQISQNSYVETYAFNSAFPSGEQSYTVLNYDGLNTYMANVGIDKDLYNVPTFKSSTNTVGTAGNYDSTRDSIIKLAPNSVTKVRVYVWLEGQDIDNIDFSGAITRKLAVKFGFTKDRFETLEQRPNS